MRSGNDERQNPLRCPKCGNYRYLRFDGVKFKDKSKTVGIKVPFYDCTICDIKTPVVPSLGIYNRKDAEDYYKDVANNATKTMKKGETATLTSSSSDRFPKFESLGYIYDSRDYHNIPRLYRDWNIGHLCPVFFDIELLLYYNNHPDYRVVFSSLSRLHILNKDKEAIIPHNFGINRSGKIICWLGDLYESLSKPENERHKKLFSTFNLESDHDIVSDYYFGQIETDFTEPDNAIQVFELRNAFDAAIIKTKGVDITHISFDDLANDFKHPILNETDQINGSYMKLNSILIESFDIPKLKGLILESGIPEKDIKGFRGLKLFEKFVQFSLGHEDASSTVTPLFTLYDLRVLAGHIKDSDFENKMNSCKERLKLPLHASEIETYNALIQALIDMYKILLSMAKKVQSI